MSGTLARIALRSAPLTAPVGVAVAAPLMGASDTTTDLATTGAMTIAQIPSQIAMRAATKAALSRAAAPELGGAIARGAMAVGGRLAGRAAILAVPVVGEAAAAGMMAYGVASFGYEAITGKSFDDTMIGRSVSRATTGALHMAADAAGGVMDGLGLRQAARFVRGPVNALLTGQDSTEPPTKSQTPPMPADRTTLVMKPGPVRPLSDADWKEAPYRLDPATMTQTMKTTPMSRAFAVMNMLSDDSGLERRDRLDFRPAQVSAAPARTKTQGLD